jgi:hypothetical protein
VPLLKRFINDAEELGKIEYFVWRVLRGNSNLKITTPFDKFEYELWQYDPSDTIAMTGLFHWAGSERPSVLGEQERQVALNFASELFIPLPRPSEVAWSQKHIIDFVENPENRRQDRFHNLKAKNQNPVAELASHHLSHPRWP